MQIDAHAGAGAVGNVGLVGMTVGERRKSRSDDPQQALALKLSHVRDEAHLDALVLASHEGLPIAQAGDAALCSELAALAPLLSRGHSVGNRVDIAHELLSVRAVEFEGTALYLASCSDIIASAAEVDLFLAEATRGVTRILAA